MEASLATGAGFDGGGRADYVEYVATKILGRMGTDDGREMPEGAADLVFKVLWDQLATPDKGERSGAVDGYLGVGEILKSDGLKYRTFSDAVITLLPGRKKRRGWEGGWDMRLRPMEGAEVEAIRGDKYERVFEKLEGKGGLGLGVREVPELLMPEDFTETELVMFLDGVVRNLD
jgi:hypothetical protein